MYFYARFELLQHEIQAINDLSKHLGEGAHVNVDSSSKSESQIKIQGLNEGAPPPRPARLEPNEVVVSDDGARRRMRWLDIVPLACR